MWLPLQTNTLAHTYSSHRAYPHHSTPRIHTLTHSHAYASHTVKPSHRIATRSSNIPTLETWLRVFAFRQTIVCECEFWVTASTSLPSPSPRTAFAAAATRWRTDCSRVTQFARTAQPQLSQQRRRPYSWEPHLEQAQSCLKATVSATTTSTQTSAAPQRQQHCVGDQFRCARMRVCVCCCSAYPLVDCRIGTAEHVNEQQSTRPAVSPQSSPVPPH